MEDKTIDKPWVQMPKQLVKRRIGLLTVDVISGPAAGHSATLNKDRVTIGRSPGADIPLNDPHVSALHIEITIRDSVVRLRDLDSSNGVFIGGRRIRDVDLALGDVIRLGDTQLRLTRLGERDVALSTATRFGKLYGNSRWARELFAELEFVSKAQGHVIVLGETGTGKDLVGQAIHEHSARSNGPFVRLNCGDLSGELAAQELFGRARGAYTGADTDRQGAFEQATGGTLFIDEIGELSAAHQTKLLAVLENREVSRLGETRVREVDVRVVCATHRDLRKLAAEGHFRLDLFHRLEGHVVHLRPLRERDADLAFLARQFLREVTEELELGPRRFTAATVAALASRDWPGNIRELRNVVRRAAQRSNGEIAPEDLGGGLEPGRSALSLAGLVRTLPWSEGDKILRELRLAYLMSHCNGVIRAAAEQAGVSRNALKKWLREHGMYREPTLAPKS